MALAGPEIAIHVSDVDHEREHGKAEQRATAAEAARDRMAGELEALQQVAAITAAYQDRIATVTTHAEEASARAEAQAEEDRAELKTLRAELDGNTGGASSRILPTPGQVASLAAISSATASGNRSLCSFRRQVSSHPRSPAYRASPDVGSQSLVNRGLIGGLRSARLHVLALIDDEGLRRGIKGIRNLQEGRHSLAEKVFHGRKSQLFQRYYEGMEDQLGALSAGTSLSRA
nr:Tn3 family transposase [Sphaerisporangium fuscum]